MQYAEAEGPGGLIREPLIGTLSSYLMDIDPAIQVIIADLPDPRNEGLAKLYSREFYGLVRRHLARGGVFVTQSSSPYYVRRAYWCVAHTGVALLPGRLAAMEKLENATMTD